MFKVIQSKRNRLKPHRSGMMALVGHAAPAQRMHLGPCCLLLLLIFAMPLKAQDTVTVPKSRLEELEQKERELERLKKESAKPLPPAPSAQKSTLSTPVSTSGETSGSPILTKSTPAIASLPPLEPGQIVDSLDLAHHYHTDPAAADRRYGGQRLSVRGEIVGFEKPLLRRNYKIALQSPDRETKVVCDIYPPEKFSSVFTVDHGSQLVGAIGETRIPITKIGDKVLVTGRCKGLRESAVLITGGELKTSQ